MPIAKIIEISAQSEKGFDDALRQGLETASKSVHGIRSAWIKDQQVMVDNGRITSYRLDLKVTFVVD